MGKTKAAKATQELVQQAVALLKHGKWNEAREAHERLINTGVHKAAGYYGLGVIQMQAGELEAAMDSFCGCIKEDHFNAHAVYNVGVISARQKDLENARKAFLKALEMDPYMDDALKGLRSLVVATPRRTTKAARNTL